MRSELRWTLLWMHHLQGSLVGRPPRFGDLEMCPNSFGNYLLLPFSLHAFIYCFLACHVLMIIMLNVMIFRLVTYMYSI